MNKKPYIFTDFITKFEYDTTNIPPLLINHITDGEAIMSTSIDGQTKMSEDPTLFLDEISVHVMSKMAKNGEPVFNLHVVKSALIRITDEEIDEDVLLEILTATVRQEMYDSLKPLIEEFFLNTGYPPIKLEDFRFSGNTNEITTDNPKYS